MGLPNGHAYGDDLAAWIMQATSIVDGRPLEFIGADHFTIQQPSCLRGLDLNPQPFFLPAHRAVPTFKLTHGFPLLLESQLDCLGEPVAELNDRNSTKRYMMVAQPIVAATLASIVTGQRTSGWVTPN